MQVSLGSSSVDASSSSADTHGVPVFASGGGVAYTLVTGLLSIWGLSNNLTDILVQQFRKSFTLSQLEAQLVQTAVFLGYFLMAMPAAAFMRRYGNRAGILLGLLLFGCGPAILARGGNCRYTPFLIALLIVGCGSATLESAANPLVAEFGPPTTSERRLNFAQSFNPVGSITGVLIGTIFIFSGVELTAARSLALRQSGQYGSYMHAEIMRVVPTYVGLGIVVLLSALLIAPASFPAFALRSRESGKGGSGMTQFGRALAELNIEILCANSSQAKGRVERANRTLQNRLVKDLRMAGICDMNAGSSYLPQFVE